MHIQKQEHLSKMILCDLAPPPNIPKEALVIGTGLLQKDSHSTVVMMMWVIGQQDAKPRVLIYFLYFSIPKIK
jgi:hypothetical protein